MTSLTGGVAIVDIVAARTTLQFASASARRASNLGNDQINVQITIRMLLNLVLCRDAQSVYEESLQPFTYAHGLLNQVLQIPEGTAI